ncbi:hypothetical protein SLS60_011928 [Paraconiothyrium brasiliense]|uniref:Uncharacterized protein n=1 Tax=Paraconiothyrium brasiliense TaxID=300254 RepID=A0ABR3QH98_9PLEO
MDGDSDDVKVWEVFFPQIHINGIGDLQDAAALTNDPALTAMSESAALFPFKDTPDLLLSIGTGLSQVGSGNPDNEISPTRAVLTGVLIKILRNRWLWRLCRTFSSRMLERPVKQALNTRPWYHRLDLKMDSAEPRLDDVSSIAALKERIVSDLSSRLPIKRIAHCAIATLFIFKLDDVPSQYDGPYRGHGRILCRLDPREPALAILLERLLASRSSFYLDEKPLGCGPSPPDDVFEIKVKLALNCDFSIVLKQADGGPCHISGSPFSVRRLAEEQKMHAPFGTSEHRAAQKVVPSYGNSEHRGKLQDGVAEFYVPWEADLSSAASFIADNLKTLSGNAKPDITLAPLVDDVLKDFIFTAHEDDPSEDAQKAYAWLHIRITRPTKKYDEARWHQDGPYVALDPARGGDVRLKYCLTLLGPGTIFLEHTQALASYTGTTEFREDRSKAAERLSNLGVYQSQVGEVVRCTWKRSIDDTSGDVHSEPRHDQDRVFLALVLMSKDEIDDLTANRK